MVVWPRIVVLLTTFQSALASHVQTGYVVNAASEANYSSEPLGHAVCDNTCTGDPQKANPFWVNDGICDDGGPGHFWADCDWGTDCDDCKPRDG